MLGMPAACQMPQKLSEELSDQTGGPGEHLLGGIDALKLGYRCTEHIPTPNVTHVVLTMK